MVRQCTKPGERLKRESRRRSAGPCTLVAATILGCCTGYDSVAVNRIVLEVGQLSTARVQVSEATITLDVPPGSDNVSLPTSRVQVTELRLSAPNATAASATAAAPGTVGSGLQAAAPGSVTSGPRPAPLGTDVFRDIDVHCSELVVRKPVFACNQGSFSGRGGPLGRMVLSSAAVSYDSSTGATSFRASGLEVAGATTRFDGSLQSGGIWSLNADADRLDLEAARKLMQPWYRLPEGDSLSGHVQLRMEATGRMAASDAAGADGAGYAAAGGDGAAGGSGAAGGRAGGADGAGGAGNGASTAAGAVGKLQARLTASSTDLNYSNQPGTTVGQNVAAAVTGTAQCDHGGHCVSDLQVRSSSGQVLAGSVLLDFAKNPLDLQAHVEPGDERLAITQLRIRQTDLIDAQGEAHVLLRSATAPNSAAPAVAGTAAAGGSAPAAGLAVAAGSARGADSTPAAGLAPAAASTAAVDSPPFTLERAHLDVYRLDFAAAYRSFLQLTLATTDFGALNVGGRAGGSLDIAQGQLSEIHAFVQNVSMADATSRLSLANANGELHWTSDPRAAVKPSQLSWSSSSAYGLIGGPVEMGFTAQGANFTLARNTRFPVFDGALVIHTLAIRGFGAPNTELDFDAHLEPISMPLLSKAFGWPVLQGQLAGAIPGVTYRDHVLAVQGDLVANVFDGIILGSHLKLTNPWGPWPRLNADVTARHLDLDLLTHTFSIGSISGRLDADILGLELFNWSPVAFDAKLQTTPGDRSKHLISQRAVTSISNVGGGGGGVTAALQSGVLKFFKTFHYDRIGIRCQLRDEVCLMGGIEPARSGYYLVKGRGLPRIDIIGNSGRVDWAQLVGQISASMHSQNITVR